MTHDEWQHEVNAAFRATWGRDRFNGRHGDDSVPPLSRIKELEQTCKRCGYIFWVKPELRSVTPNCHTCAVIRKPRVRSEEA